MNIFKEIKQDLENTALQIYNNQDIWSQFSIEIPKDELNGDITTNIAMIIASKTGGCAREIALKFKNLLLDITYISHIEVAGAGFINFFIKVEKWHSCISSIINNDPKFWTTNIGKGLKVNIEYVSANPTGPMHIGHARGAVYGDVLANILIKCGYNVTKEYYINDFGSQIDTLIQSVILRYKEIYNHEIIKMPRGLYPGDYLKKVGQKLAEKYKDKLLNIDFALAKKYTKHFIIYEMMKLIKLDLADLGIQHDVFFSEQSLHDRDKILESINILEQKGLLYKGILSAPKGKVYDEWETKEQMLFRSSKFGDEEDRSIQKSNGDWSYLAADFAYAKDKIDRGFQTLIYILGADHIGYIKRIKAVISALSENKVTSDIRITQLVNFIKEGRTIKMSKRNGEFITVRDVINEVGKDIIRFIMLTRRNDVALDFDLDKVKEQSKDNPVFYVQYAHVRAKSIICKAKENLFSAYKEFYKNNFDLSLLNSKEEIQLMKLLSSWPKVLSISAISREPQKIAYFLIDVSSLFHFIWNLGKENTAYRFNIECNPDLTSARLALVDSVRKVISEGFKVMGITPMDKM